MAENKLYAKPKELLRGLARSIGRVISDPVETELYRRDQILESMRLTLQMHVYFDHSNADSGEVEYYLGKIRNDPHPNHTIIFTKCEHSPEEIYGPTYDPSFGEELAELQSHYKPFQL